MFKFCIESNPERLSDVIKKGDAFQLEAHCNEFSIASNSASKTRSPPEGTHSYIAAEVGHITIFNYVAQ